jgi:hypothetical protein
MNSTEILNGMESFTEMMDFARVAVELELWRLLRPSKVQKIARKMFVP